MYTSYDWKIIVFLVRGILVYHIVQDLFLLVHSNHVQSFLDISGSILGGIKAEIEALGTGFRSLCLALVHGWRTFNNFLASFL